MHKDLCVLHVVTNHYILIVSDAYALQWNVNYIGQNMAFAALPVNIVDVDNDLLSDGVDRVSSPDVSDDDEQDLDDCDLASASIKENSEASDKKKHLSKTEKKRKRFEEKIAHQKQQRKLNKQKVKAKEQNFNHSDDGDSRLSRREQQRQIKAKLQEGLVSGQRICVDLSLESCMSHKECSRLAQQLCRLYGSNRNADKAAHVYFTGINKSGFLYQECVRKNSGFENYLVEMTEKSLLEVFNLEEIVYLSPNSANVLETVEDDKVYVLGGLVDESVQKNVTQSNAEKLNIKTMRLPIAEHMGRTESGSFNPILTINQVFDILLAFIETGVWKVALPRGVPQRKGFILIDQAPEAE
jgi:hypothetical protein